METLLGVGRRADKMAAIVAEVIMGAAVIEVASQASLRMTYKAIT